MLDKEKKPYLNTTASIEYHGKKKSESDPIILLQLLLNRAAVRGDIDMLLFMKNNGTDHITEKHLKEALKIAIENRQESSSLFLIQWGGNEVTGHIDKITRETFLHKSAFKGMSKVCSEILNTNHSLSIDAKTRDKSTALHFAVASGNLETVKVLVNAGASLKIKNSHNNTAKAIAVMYNYQEIIKCLENGKSRNSGCEPNMDPLAPPSSSSISRMD